MVMYDFLLRHQGSLRLTLGTDVYSLERAPFYFKKTVLGVEYKENYFLA